MHSLARAITGLELPAVEKISEEQAEDPFQILIATILSAQCTDVRVNEVTSTLFPKYPTAADFAQVICCRMTFASSLDISAGTRSVTTTTAAERERTPLLMQIPPLTRW